MVFEFRKAAYSVHYQGAAAALAAQRPRLPTQVFTASLPELHSVFFACGAAWFIAGIFVILAVSASIYEVGAEAGRRLRLSRNRWAVAKSNPCPASQACWCCPAVWGS